MAIHMRILGTLLLLLGISTVLGLSGCAGPPRPSVFSGDTEETRDASPEAGQPERSGNPAGRLDLGAEVVQSAAQYLGTPYRYGGASAGGMDCSGLVMSVFSEHGIVLPRSCAAQAKRGRGVHRSDLREGDLVFFGNAGSPPSHVGIYQGDGRFIHASTGKGKVRYDALSAAWFRDHYRGARRVLPDADPAAGQDS